MDLSVQNSCGSSTKEDYYFFEGTTDLLAEVELKTNEQVTIVSELHLKNASWLQDDLWLKSQIKAAERNQLEQPKVKKLKVDHEAELDLENRRKEALSDIVKCRRTYCDSPEEIRTRQEIRTRRDHNKDWIRRWQDKSSKYRVLNLNNLMNVNKVDQELNRMEDMIRDVVAMKRRFILKLRERAEQIKIGALDPKEQDGPLGAIKAVKMVNWMQKVKEVSDLAEMDMDLQSKMKLFQKAVVRIAERANGIPVIQPLI